MHCLHRVQPGWLPLPVHWYAACAGGGGRLRGIVVMSGYLPHSSCFAMSPGLESTPVFQGHGTLNPLMCPDAARESRGIVTSGRGGTDYRLVTYPNLS
jgi:predicted esterase